MPNKDSFTFSDKLKKSKSLPLSKRIPSRSGGDGKAKRTLIQRAQRDLPFIIVAAAALLLLPLLSRNSGTDYVSGLDNLGYDNFVGDGGHGLDYIPGDGDIVPADRRNPLDMIITNKGHQDTPAMEEDEYEPPTSSMIDDNRRESFSHEEVTSKPNISTYGKAAKGGIRNSATRKPTALGALRNRNLSFGNGNGGLTRNLAIGGAPTRNPSPSAPRAGVRPVALQPMTTSGAGRVLTGDNLYRERDRAIGALNQGPAKQALFEAQLRDVDGSPLGAAGDPRAAAARLASQGTVPDHKFNYTNQKPWWWDMMQERSQKLWELWNYNWQKALSDSLIKVATNLGMCLLTGSEDGSVKNFLGIKPGDDSTVCVKDGKQVGRSFEDFAAVFKGSAGKDGSVNSLGADVYEAWLKSCANLGGHEDVDPAGQKNALQARLECLGLKAGKLSGLSKTRYNANCDGVNQKPIRYTVSATRKDGRVREKKQEKVVIYVLAREKNTQGTINKNAKKDSNDLFIIKLNEPTDNTLTISESELAQIQTKCEITNIGSFKANQTKKEIANNIAKAKERATEGWRYCSSLPADFPSKPLTRSDLFDLMDAKDRSKAIAEIGSNECQVLNSDVEINPVGINQGANNIECGDGVKEGLKAAQTKFYADIKGLSKKDRVFAVVVENGKNNEGEGVFIRTIDEVTAEQNSAFRRAGAGNNGADRFFTQQLLIGENSVVDSKATPNNGRVYWIVTNANIDKSYANTFHAGKLITQVDVKTLVGINGAYKVKTCDYSWGCSSSICPTPPDNDDDDDNDEYCAVKDGSSYSFFNAVKVQKGDATVFLQKSTNPISDEAKRKYLAQFGIDANNENCGTCIAGHIGNETDGKDKIHLCQPICKKRLEAEQREILRKSGSGEGQAEDDGSPLIASNVISGIPGLEPIVDNDALCPFCNPTDVEIKKACNFAAYLSFDTTSFKANETKQFDDAYAKFLQCLQTVSDNTSAGQNLYVTGFTSFAGSDAFEKCPTYDNGVKNKNSKLDSWGAVDVNITTGVVKKYNYGPKGNQDTEARKKCNQALSEDRAIYSMHKMFERLQKDDNANDLVSKVKVSLSPEATHVVGFENVTPKDELDTTGYKRYKDREDRDVSFGNGRIQINIAAKGCGPKGAKPGDVASDRVIYFSVNDKECSREGYKSELSN